MSDFLSNDFQFGFTSNGPTPGSGQTTSSNQPWWEVLAKVGDNALANVLTYKNQQNAYKLGLAQNGPLIASTFNPNTGKYEQSPTGLALGGSAMILIVVVIIAVLGFALLSKRGR